MQGYFSGLYQTKYKEVKDMSKPELIEELTKFRNMWTWCQEEVQYWLTHTRYPCRVVRRDYQGFKGLLGTVHFELKSIDVDVEDEIYNYLKGTKTTEFKTVTIPINQLVDFEFIHQEEVRPINDRDEDEEKLEKEGELSLSEGG